MTADGAAAFSDEVRHRMLHGDFELSAAEHRRRELKHHLAAEVRRLVEHAALVDAVSCSEGELERAVDAVRATTEVLGVLDSLRHQGLNATAGWQGALTERSPVSGRSNPLAAPLDLRPDGLTTVGSARYGLAHEGPEGTVHGGVVVAAFDELLGVAQAASGSAGLTGTLTIRMHRPTPLGETISYLARPDAVDGRKIRASGESFAGGEVLCEAKGLFIAPRGRPLTERVGGDGREAKTRTGS